MRRWMEANGVRHVLVVSDPQHMLRVSYSWWSVFRGSGLRYTFVAAPTPDWSAWHWWENEAIAIASAWRCSSWCITWGAIGLAGASDQGIIYNG